MKILEIIKNINSENHYFTIPSVVYDTYLQDLNKLLERLEKIVGQKKLEDILNKKLQTGLAKFNENQFLQSACELTAMSTFLGRDNIDFCYERKIHTPKDVDFSILIENKRFNIEVKCPSFKNESRGADDIQVNFMNRAPSVEDKKKILESISASLNNHSKNTIETKNLDNTLKDFLISTQEKVIQSSIEENNILLIACDDELSVHTWRGYLFGYGGFFTERSHVPHEEFDRVDYVLLTNIYNRHHRYFSDVKIKNHWDLKSSFNLLYPNRFSKRNISHDNYSEFKLISSIIDNKSTEFEKYFRDKNDLPEGESYEAKELVLGVAFYADKFKKNGIFYFK